MKRIFVIFALLIATITTGVIYKAFARDGGKAIVPNETIGVTASRLMGGVDGSLPGVFSVSDTKRVLFSKGNLQYNPAQNIWRFAEHQYDLLDTDPTQMHVTTSYTATSTDWIDLLGWGTWTVNGAEPWTTSIDYNDYLTGVASSGEFENFCKEGIGEGWRTLSAEEWLYLIINANKSGKLGEGKVNGVSGVILFPNNWTYPTDISEESTSAQDFKDFASGVNVLDNTYTASDWAKMEDLGAVFLPSAGIRAGESVAGVGFGGRYWSSTATSEGFAFSVYFYTAYLVPNENCGQLNGCSVRLVHDF